MIQTLTDEVINCLAAGEVVEKPASVLKELVENSLDAGATQIDVSIMAGGSELICVIDNGHGMSAEDAVHCFGRHATSKLREFEDMLTLKSLGFRGEALAAIASVSRVRLCTREADAEMGTEIILEGGTIQSVREIGVPTGTRFEIKDLFFNTPARLKFLKRDTTEAKWLEEYLKALALSAPQTEFRFSSQGKPKWQMQYDASWCAHEEGPDPERVIACIGESAREDLLPFTSQTDNLSVCGFLVGPNVSRRDTKGIRLMVNGRWVADRELIQTIKAAYRPYLEHGRHPMCVLHLKIAPERVDFNAHPQKTEIRITHRREIQSSLIRMITVFLVTQKPQSLLDLKREPHTYAMKNTSPASTVAQNGAHARDWFPPPTLKMENTIQDRFPRNDLSPPHQLGSYVLVSILFGNVALLKQGEGWWLFDLQHYSVLRRRERLMDQILKGSVLRQRLLFPEQVTSPSIKPTEQEYIEKGMAEYGFDVSLFDDQNWMIKSVPVELGDENPIQFFESLSRVLLSEKENSIEKRHQKVMSLFDELKTPSLTNEEVESLVNEISLDTSVDGSSWLCPLNETHLKTILKAPS